ncbi:MAG: tetratricopeptide repeat protein [Magnetococcales bacterium]|nr:tetratricopeptide repeat protein [Magnetococcales bacterium]
MNRTKHLLTALVSLGLLFSGAHGAEARLKKGDPLPQFVIRTTQGDVVSEKNFQQSNLGVIYFFKMNKCKSCLTGLESLKGIGDAADKGIQIVAVGKEDDASLNKFAQGLGLTFQVGSAEKQVFKSFSASLLPTTLLVGPDGQVLKVIHGGGKHAAKLMTELASTQLDRQDPAGAQALFAKAAKLEANPAVEIGLAYSDLKSGNLERAQATFKKLSASPDTQVAMQAKEGLAEVLFQKGETKAALSTAESVLAEDPNRSMANLVKGKSLHSQGKSADAKKALTKAVSGGAQAEFSWQKSDAHLALGNLEMKNAKSQIALKSFKQAAAENPFSADALSNQGVALKNMGNPEEALKVFKKLKKVHTSDVLVHALMRQAQSAIAQKQDLERQKYIDGMVTDLVARFKEIKKLPPPKDTWTSPAGALSILGFQNNAQGNLSGRIGMEGILKDELTRELGDLNVSVVDREILDKVLAELKLGSSDLANPKTRTKLGKITAAHVMATGSFYNQAKGSTATMRLVETETTDIFLALSKNFEKSLDPSQLAAEWAEKIAAKVREQHPLQGRIVSIKPKQIIINLGKRHAVTKGLVFNVLSEGEAIDLGDGEVVYDYDQLGQIEVTKVRDKIAYAQVVTKSGEWAKQQKIIIASAQ